MPNEPLNSPVLQSKALLWLVILVTLLFRPALLAHPPKGRR